MKKTYYILIILIASISFSYGQKTDTLICKIIYDNSINRDYYKTTDTPPSYKGSNELMFAYLRNNILIPKNCEKGNYNMYAELIVEQDGKLTFLKFIKTNAPKELNDAFKKVIATMPNWTPATCNKKNVASYFILPFTVYPQTVSKSDTLTQNAEFIGGKDSLVKFVDANFKFEKKGLCDYPNSFHVEFIVDEYGKFSSLTALKPQNAEIALELIRVFKLMPNWKPATQNGKFVQSKQSINFRINNK